MVLRAGFVEGHWTALAVRIEYALWVTDPNIERPYLAGEDGHYELGECYLTISLGEPFNDHCYKLVAAVVQRRPRRIP